MAMRKGDYDPNTGQMKPYMPSIKPGTGLPGAGPGTPRPTTLPAVPGRKPTRPSVGPRNPNRPNTRPMPPVKTPEPDVFIQPFPGSGRQGNTPPAYMVEMYRRMMQRRNGQ